MMTALDQTTGLRLGIDLGGTKIEGVVMNRDGAELARRRLATPRGDYAATIAAIAGIVSELESLAGSGQLPIGLGMPGSLVPTSGLVQNANSTWLNDRPFGSDLAAALGDRVRLANDANCFALSEAVDGAGAGYRGVFGVILGTGCGGGLVIDGRLVNGPRAIGGEWGHNPLPWPRESDGPAPRCWCGRDTCMETWVSGPGLEAAHVRDTGERVSAEEIAHRAGAGDAAALKTLDRHADQLVLGGGLSKLTHLYARLPSLIAPYVFAADTTVEVSSPKWGDSSGVRGAARLWP
jgi:fructokinase